MPAPYSLPDEPVLEIDDIQANVLVGLDTRHQIFLFFEIIGVPRARQRLQDLTGSVTSVDDVLSTNRGHEHDPADARPAGEGPPMVNLAFTFQGLRKLGADAGAFLDLPFRDGMHTRSKLLGDPVRAGAPGNSTGWVIGGPHNVPDLVVMLAGADERALAAREAAITRAFSAGLRLLHRDDGMKLPGMREHFGFRDPVSQPGVRGRLPGSGHRFLTPRRVPGNPHQGRPGQNLVWPGEFVFGYPAQDPMDPAEPGLVSRAGPAWAKNGSLLVFRRIRQDVSAFREFLGTAAELAARTPGLGEMTPELMAAKLLGRWPSGAPLMLSPDHDDVRLGADDAAVNDFRYLEGPGTGGDPHGLICPPAAHVRKVYPRDHATSMDTAESMDTHRLLRRGIPYGPPFPEAGERGLLFLAYQTSIERQFEFITRSWLNHPNLRSFRDGHDPIAGQRAYGLGGRDFALPYRRPDDGSVDCLRLDLPGGLTTVTGGGYFFAPSISALRHLATAPDIPGDRE